MASISMQVSAMRILVVWCCTFAACLAQESGTINDPSGGSGSPLNARIRVLPGNELPVGWGAKLLVRHDRVRAPEYYWQAECNSVIHTSTDWNTSAIFSGCVGTAGAYKFLSRFTHKSPNIVNPGESKKTVTWQPPNRYVLKVKPPELRHRDLPFRQVVTDVEVTLFWQDKLFGPCARACVQEKWTFKAQVEELLPREDSSIKNWWPRCDAPVSQQSIHRSEQSPAPTWRWQSPTLIDSNSMAMEYAHDWSDRFTEDQLLGTQEHAYRFRDSNCKGDPWQLDCSFTLKLVAKTIPDVGRTPVFVLD